MNNQGFYAPDPLPRWKRWLQAKLFPQQYLQPLAEDGDPNWTPGEAMTRVTTNLDWKDRLRVLLVGRCHFEIRHRTDVPIARLASRGQFNVPPPQWLQAKPQQFKEMS